MVWMCLRDSCVVWRSAGRDLRDEGQEGDRMWLGVIRGVAWGVGGGGGRYLGWFWGFWY